jgi:predicted DNA-binding transcriptional regulator YafY
MARNNQISRIYNILILLEFAPHGITVTGLLDRLSQRGHNAGKRTIYRDLKALQQAGFPLTPKGADADNAQRWILERRTQVTKTMPLTDLEAIVLQQVYGILQGQSSPELREAALGLIGKVASQLGADRKFQVAA